MSSAETQTMLNRRQARNGERIASIKHTRTHLGILVVTPAKAGVQTRFCRMKIWIPALRLRGGRLCAGMTVVVLERLVGVMRYALMVEARLAPAKNA